MYTESEVRQLITGYHWRCNLLENKVYEYDSTSTGQYGIEATLPKAQGGTGDKVLVRVIRNDKDRQHSKKLIEEIEFVDNHEHCITNDKNYHILQLLKRGENVTTIHRLLDISRTNVHGRIDQIVNDYIKAQQG